MIYNNNNNWLPYTSLQLPKTHFQPTNCRAKQPQSLLSTKRTMPIQALTLTADEKSGVALMQSLEFLPPEVKIKSVRLQGCDRDYNLCKIDTQTQRILRFSEIAKKPQFCVATRNLSNILPSKQDVKPFDYITVPRLWFPHTPRVLACSQFRALSCFGSNP